MRIQFHLTRYSCYIHHILNALVNNYSQSMVKVFQEGVFDAILFIESESLIV